ncbi:CBS domain-containing protein [Thiorhodococcus mannitoliphagus]|uniref:Magnesium and cobalt efflux protein CorC n=1 Tax=Thiorhodococcus mannitoliphagus TaxID=329406 RepID=A0A6P1E1L5_9GAMM|nr:transporter associated domain-containing protein [Thiorhodococcus mannitoliphagus]NEX22956.1 CBS domain-containing protein [Thiorhodococcus mannitoliphagus]
MTSDRSSNGSQSRGWLGRLGHLLGGEPQDKEQLIELLKDARQREVLDTDALSMIEGVLQVSDLRVRDIMIPRAEMVSLRRDDPLEKILNTAVKSAHSRFPVTGDDKGEVVGILLAKDLLSFCMETSRRAFNIRDLLRSAVFVPESKRLNVLLKEFRSSRNHMAIVVDEYGNAAGLVTIEDVLEQIVGEIEDEHDYDEGAGIFRRSPSTFSVKARTAIEDFNEYFGSDFSDEDLDTIGGLVVNAFGHLPKRGESVELGRFRFSVVRADSRRVHMLNAELLDPENGLPGSSEDDATH